MKVLILILSYIITLSNSLALKEMALMKNKLQTFNKYRLKSKN